MRTGLVSVVLVNWNSGQRLPRCLAALRQQHYTALELILIDNGSTDGSLELAEAADAGVTVVRNGHNAGYCRAFNQGVELAAGEYILGLNSDVWPQPAFISTLIESLETAPQAGMACGKLLHGAGPDDGRRIDSTGLFLGRTRRPYDRGQGAEDRGQYDAGRDVFAAGGAAWLCRRTMLQDVMVDGEVLDEDFFAYYDDVDLGWRAQMRGWCCRYAPAAVAWHERGSGDTLRRLGHSAKHAFAQRHALKNRYLMLLKNDDWGSLTPSLPALLAGDLARVGYVVVRRRELLGAYLDAWRLRGRALAKRHVIQGGRRVEPAELRRWFR